MSFRLKNNSISHVLSFAPTLLLTIFLGYRLSFCTHRRLQENKLEKLDSHLFLKLRSLRILDLSQNQLSSLPPELFQSIYHIKGEHHGINFIDTRRYCCCSLHLLSVSLHLTCLFSILVINFSQNKLPTIPTLQEQTKLEDLDVSRNEIRFISSDDFKYLRSLRYLRVSENFIGNLSSLKIR